VVNKAKLLSIKTTQTGLMLQYSPPTLYANKNAKQRITDPQISNKDPNQALTNYDLMKYYDKEG
jgi:hypothetical protein